MSEGQECKPFLERPLPRNFNNLCWFNSTNAALFHKKRNIFEKQPIEASNKLFMDIYKYFSCGEIESGKNVLDLYKEFRSSDQMNKDFNLVSINKEVEQIEKETHKVLSPYKKIAQINELKDGTFIRSNFYSKVRETNPLKKEIEEITYYPLMDKYEIEKNDIYKATNKEIKIIDAQQDIKISLDDKVNLTESKFIKILSKEKRTIEGKIYINFSINLQSFDKEYNETFNELYFFFLPEEEYDTFVKKKLGSTTTQFSISDNGMHDATEYLAQIIKFCKIPDTVFPLRTGQKYHFPIVDVLVENSQDFNTIQNQGYLQNIDEICKQDMLIVRMEPQKKNISAKHLCETLTFYTNEGKICIYKLDAISVHITDNHYLTILKEDDKWYLYNDSGIENFSILKETTTYTFLDIMEKKGFFKNYDNVKERVRFLVYSREVQTKSEETPASESSPPALPI